MTNKPIKSSVLMFIIIVGFSACHNQRFIAEQAIENTRKIRTAEDQYTNRLGQENYGSIDDLIAQKLLSENFRDGSEGDYNFVLIAEKDHYHLTVLPLPIENSEKQSELSLYLDETKIIRASPTADKVADSSSSPVVDKYRKSTDEN